VTDLNPWLPLAKDRARRVLEDSDRIRRMEQPLMQLIEQLHHAAVSLALDLTCPKAQRLDLEQGVTIELGWSDSEADWDCNVSVSRNGADIVTWLHLHTDIYRVDLPAPSDDAIRDALWKYHAGWRKA